MNNNISQFPLKCKILSCIGFCSFARTYFDSHANCDNDLVLPYLLYYNIFSRSTLSNVLILNLLFRTPSNFINSSHKEGKREIFSSFFSFGRTDFPVRPFVLQTHKDYIILDNASENFFTSDS